MSGNGHHGLAPDVVAFFQSEAGRDAMADTIGRSLRPSIRATVSNRCDYCSRPTDATPFWRNSVMHVSRGLLG